MKAGIYMVGTPIGHLDDISRRAVETLGAVDYILAEDTRHTRGLLNRYTIQKPLVSCHQFNEASRVHQVVRHVQGGGSVALVSNAGMPAVSDPGSRVVAACRKEGLYVTVIPGPSSVTAAMALCGYVSGGFLFEGFLPRKPGARRRRLAEVLALGLPVVMFESPYRILAVLGELETLAAARELFVARELTKMNEECLWGTPSELLHRYEDRALKNPGRKIKGECVLVLSPDLERR